MPLQISIEKNISFLELSAKKQEGHYVTATPHVGNLPIRVLGLLDLGFDVNFVDVNLGSKDDIFYPHNLVKNNAKTKIACPNTLSTHNYVWANNESLVDFHLAKLQRNHFPQAVSHYQWLQTRQKLVLSIMEDLLTENTMMLWKRYVNQDGSVTTRLPNSKPELRAAMHKISSDYNKPGFITPNAYNILLDIVIGAMESSKETVYMLSGLVMHKYISNPYAGQNSMILFLEKEYEKLLGTGKYNLPSNLQVKMVPAANIAHFVVPFKHKAELNSKLSYFERLQQANKRCAFLVSSKLTSAQKLKLHATKRKCNFKQLCEKLKPFTHSTWDGIFYTQHDFLAEENSSLYLHPESLNKTIAELENQTNKMLQLSN